MTRYDYINETVNNIKDYIDENIDYVKDYSFDELYDELWVADSVTGNASGSYYCNAYKAEEALAGNWELLAEALEDPSYAGLFPEEG